MQGCLHCPVNVFDVPVFDLPRGCSMSMIPCRVHKIALWCQLLMSGLVRKSRSHLHMLRLPFARTVMRDFSTWEYLLTSYKSSLPLREFVLHEGKITACLWTSHSPVLHHCAPILHAAVNSWQYKPIKLLSVLVLVWRISLTDDFIATWIRDLAVYVTVHLLRPTIGSHSILFLCAENQTPCTVAVQITSGCCKVICVPSQQLSERSTPGLLTTENKL